VCAPRRHVALHDLGRALLGNEHGVRVDLRVADQGLGQQVRGDAIALEVGVGDKENEIIVRRLLRGLRGGGCSWVWQRGGGVLGG
jgi:hypothetical protein